MYRRDFDFETILAIATWLAAMAVTKPCNETHGRFEAPAMETYEFITMRLCLPIMRSPTPKPLASIVCPYIAVNLFGALPPEQQMERPPFSHRRPVPKHHYRGDTATIYRHYNVVIVNCIAYSVFD